MPSLRTARAAAAAAVPAGPAAGLLPPLVAEWHRPVCRSEGWGVIGCGIGEAFADAVLGQAVGVAVPMVAGSVVLWLLGSRRPVWVALLSGLGLVAASPLVASLASSPGSTAVLFAVAFFVAVVAISAVFEWAAPEALPAVLLSVAALVTGGLVSAAAARGVERARQHREAAALAFPVYGPSDLPVGYGLDREGMQGDHYVVQLQGGWAPPLRVRSFRALSAFAPPDECGPSAPSAPSVGPCTEAAPGVWRASGGRAWFTRIGDVEVVAEGGPEDADMVAVMRSLRVRARQS